MTDRFDAYCPRALLIRCHHSGSSHMRILLSRHLSTLRAMLYCAACYSGHNYKTCGLREHIEFGDIEISYTSILIGARNALLVFSALPAGTSTYHQAA